MAADDGSAPIFGDTSIFGAGSGSRPRTARRGERVAEVVTDPTSSPEMRMVNDSARAAAAGHNSGVADGDGPVQDPGGLLSGGVSRGSGNTWADPSSQG